MLKTNLTKIIPAVTILLLLIFGLLLRVYHLSGQSYWMDEGFTVSGVQMVLNDDRPLVVGQEKYNCFMYCYPTSLVVRAAHGNPNSNPGLYRTVATISGLLTVMMVTLFAWNYLGQYEAVIVCALMSISYWQIAWSRQARGYMLYEFFFWLALFLWWSSKHKRYWWRQTVGWLSAIAAILTHASAYLLVVIWLVWRSESVGWKKMLPLIIVSVSAATLIFLNSKWSSLVKLAFTLPYYLHFYLINYVVCIALAILGYGLGTERTRRSQRMLLWPVLIYLLFFGLFSPIVQYRYLFVITPAIYLLTTIGLVNIFKSINSLGKKVVLALLIIATLLITKHVVIWPQSSYWLESDQKSSTYKPYLVSTPQPDFAAAYHWLSENRQQQDVIISTQPVFTLLYLHEPGYWLTYKYLGKYDNLTYVTNGKEKYAGATVLNDNDFETIVQKHHGFVVIDSLATQGRLSVNILSQLNHLRLVWEETSNKYSVITIYQF